MKGKIFCHIFLGAVVLLLSNCILIAELLDTDTEVIDDDPIRIDDDPVRIDGKTSTIHFQYLGNTWINMYLAILRDEQGNEVLFQFSPDVVLHDTSLKSILKESVSIPLSKKDIADLLALFSNYGIKQLTFVGAREVSYTLSSQKAAQLFQSLAPGGSAYVKHPMELYARGNSEVLNVLFRFSGTNWIHMTQVSLRHVRGVEVNFNFKPGTVLHERVSERVIEETVDFPIAPYQAQQISEILSVPGSKTLIFRGRGIESQTLSQRNVADLQRVLRQYPMKGYR